MQFAIENILTQSQHRKLTIEYFREHLDNYILLSYTF
jgi:hypothetical protein